MQVSVSGKQIDVGNTLRDHVEHRLADAVAKYFDHAIEASVVFSREASHLRADISVHVGRGILVQGHARADNPYNAFDSASERIAKRLRRHKRRLRDHHRKTRAAEPEASVQAPTHVLAQADDAEDGDIPEPDRPVVIAEVTTEIESLTVGEAVMRLDHADQSALMFRNSAHGGLNVLYRRSDGNLGWIDPEGNTAMKRNPL